MSRTERSRPWRPNDEDGRHIDITRLVRLARARTTHPRLVLWVALGIVAVLILTVGAVVLTRPPAPARISASSTAFGFDPESLASGSKSSSGWRSTDEDVTPTITFRLPRKQELNRIEVTAPSGGTGVQAGHVEFADGSAVHFSANPLARRLALRFASRSTNRFKLVSDSRGVKASHVQYSEIVPSLDGQVEIGRDDRPDAVETTSNRSALPADAVRGDLSSWTPAADDARPAVVLSWKVAQEVDVVALTAPPGAASYRAAVSFSDGSSIELGVVAPSKTTTTAFMPRVTKSVTIRAVEGRLAVQRITTSPDEGSTSVPSSTPAASVPAPAPCTDGAASTTTLTILCPTPGTRVVAGRFTVRAHAAPNSAVTASAWIPGLQVVQQVASATADGAGSAELRVDASDLMAGPLNVLVSSGGSDAVVQVINTAGVPDRERDPAPSGLHQVFEDQFDGPLSISELGEATRYAALKPSADGSTQFGDAPFSDPALHPEQAVTVPGGYLRLQLSQVQTGSGTSQLQGSMLSSYSAAGAGFSALDGYFEARILGGPGTGAWPAFWMLSDGSAYRPHVPVSEVDAVELYGHDRRTGCHSTHNYEVDKPDLKQIDCTALASPADDWALQWHTYGVRITAHRAAFYVDGALVSRAPRTVASEQPMFFMLNLAAGGGWPVDLTATSGTSQMYVDWVRVKV